MTMKRLLLIAAACVLAACSAFQSHHNDNPYVKPLFVSRYLNPSNPQDQQIQRTIDALRANPRSPVLHNELGTELADKGFPKDAEKEFERAVDADSRYFPAWYNLGLLRAGRSDYPGAHHAFQRAIHYKPGHAAALFQLGLLEEKRGNIDLAVEEYAKAFRINHALLDVRVNPRILDTNLVHLALIKAYPREHTRESLSFQGTPAPWEGGRALLPVQPEAPSPQATPQQIVTPSAPVTEPTAQRPPVTHT
jgi:tetratricopeptide (TPR) repeat protein